MSDIRGSADAPLNILSVGAAALARSADLDAALAVLLDAACTALDAPVAAVFGQDPDRPSLDLLASRGMPPDVLASYAAEVAGNPDHPLHRAAAERQGTLGRTGTTPEGTPMTGADLALVITRNGVEEGVGVLTLGWFGTRAIGPEEGQLLLAVADLAAAAIDRFRSASIATERAEWFERMAHTDPLTGLSNSRTLARVLELEVERAKRQGTDVSVAVFDLDGFTAVNADAGTRVADTMLREVAAVLAESVRLVDTIARSGGDEFVLVAPGSAGVTVARRIIEGVGRLQPVGGRQISVSAGVARFPDDGTDVESLLEAARNALDAARAGSSPIGEAAPTT